ncbi:superoxide dismutase [Candidatus Uhrbacteria bacterium]|nr:superoxide dismutase [Candidatus Uhrbacteria bacterium]
MFEVEHFDRLLGTPGFSDQLLKNHFTLYEGYVKNTNSILERLTNMLNEGNQSSPEFAELKRRFGWEFNGMRLHQYYFWNMANGGTEISNDHELSKKITADFSSYEAWEKDFKATGVMRGIGWVILYRDMWTGQLLNTWINEHDLGHLAGSQPLLIMDVFEHAFMLDYGLKRADYIEAFFKAIDWKIVENRFTMK